MNDVLAPTQAEANLAVFKLADLDVQVAKQSVCVSKAALKVMTLQQNEHQALVNAAEAHLKVVEAVRIVAAMRYRNARLFLELQGTPGPAAATPTAGANHAVIPKSLISIDVPIGTSRVGQSPGSSSFDTSTPRTITDVDDDDCSDFLLPWEIEEMQP